ncbi:Cof-type HAD-IIB family hydrolase [Rathayibacter sp. CAU 1779]
MTLPDLRLVAADMDGTLLDEQGRVPDRLWPLLTVMRERGIAFVPASGRQYATLRHTFHSVAGELSFIAENGAYVVHDGQEVSSSTLEPSFVRTVIDDVRRLVRDGIDAGVVLCGKDVAYTDRDDPPFLEETAKYYYSRETVRDLSDHADDVIKIAVFEFGDIERDVEPTLARHRPEHQVVVSGGHWVDIMAADVNKGTALRALQLALDVTPAQTAAFGDYLNDLEMLEVADLSYAVANAHPEIARVARFRAPSNTEEGVITVLRHLLGVQTVDSDSGGSAVVCTGCVTEA